MQRQLQGQQSERLARDIEDFRRRAEALSAEEAEVGDQVSGLGDLADQERIDRIMRLTERKNEMESQVADLERDIDSTSAEFRREERGASTELQEAANGIRESKLKEKIRYSRGLIRARSPAYAEQFEAEIGNDIRDLEQQLAEAGEAVGSAGGTGLEQALDQTRDIMRGLESLDQRIRQGRARADRGAGEPGEEGRPGQNQEGQPGQSSQPGQAGQGGQGQNAQSGGQAGGAVADGAGGNRFGSPFGWGGPGDARPGDWAFDPRDVRQWQREFRERGADAQELQRMLRAENFGGVGDLAEIIQAMRNLDDPRVYESAEAIAGMQSFVIEELKRFEYRLRREVDGDRGDLFLASSDEVPDGFRDLIEEYFRALAEE